MTIAVKITDEARTFALLYGETVSQGILEMHRRLSNPKVTEVTPKVTSGNLETEIKALISRMDTFMSHGQGGIRVYPMGVETKEIASKDVGKKMVVGNVIEYKGPQTIVVEGVELEVPPRDLGFRTASEIKSGKDIPIQEVK